MKDIERAKKMLEEEGWAIVIVKKDRVLFNSKGRGIKPIYLAITRLGNTLNGASIADRVLGRAAAMLCQHVGIKEVYAGVISKSAIGLLSKGEIVFSYRESCPYILNRDGTDLCPIEKMAQDIDNVEVLIASIRNFLEKIGVIGVIDQN